ncbi:MAG: queuosine precursor transporter [Phycisphaerales bacterium]|nr:queuosine precursor transporter [Phycisphaerales bacterium]
MAGAEHNMETAAGQRVYLWLAALFVTSLLMANVIGVKLFLFKVNLSGLQFDIEHTAGMLPFPLTFVLTDLLNEYYGKRGARRVVYLAFAMAALAFVFIAAARALPILEGDGIATQEAFENIFGSSAAMYVCSIAAFLVGSQLDIVIFGVFKRLTGGRMVWLRATGSTVVSQLFDSFIITILFFMVALPVVSDAPPKELGWVVQVALTGYILKFVIAVALTPVIYAGRWAMREWFGLVPAVEGLAP